MASQGRDIRSFFQPRSKPPPAQQALEQTAPAHGGGGSETSSLSPPPPSDPASSTTPEPATPPARSRPAVIKDSDSEGSSDDSPPDLDTLWRQVNPLASAQRKDPCVTPTAKRIAVAHHTPLSIRAKRTQQAHEFDLSALQRLNDSDVAAAFQQEKTDALFSATNVLVSPSTELGQHTAKALEENLAGYAGDEEDDGGGGGAQEKLRRAIKRTDIIATRRKWCFFRQGFDPDSVPATPFPKNKANGVWKHLRDARVRKQDMFHGFPLQMINQGFALSDGVLDWVLHQIPREDETLVREQYVEIVCASARSSSIRALWDIECFCKLFHALGASEEIINDLSSKPRLALAVENPYHGRNWGRLVSVLRLVSGLFDRQLATGLVDIETVTYVTKLLIRLGIDTLVAEDVDVLESYKNALTSVVASVRDDGRDQFCFDIATCLLRSVEAAHLRWQPLSCMMPITEQLHDFRRRLAAACFFSNADLARRNTEEAVNMRAVITRVNSEAFAGGHHVDHQHLSGMLNLLDVVVDAGIGRGSDRFDAEIDELSRLVGQICRGIHVMGASHPSMLNSKTLSQWIPDRLRYAVRTVPPRKANIFAGLVMHEDDNDDSASRLKQQSMERFTKPLFKSIKQERSSTVDDV